MWSGRWPEWPQQDQANLERVTAALTSGRWTLTGGWTGVEPYERRFAQRFAEFLGDPFCVSTDHGSSSLAIALEAVGTGAGDEVWFRCSPGVATAAAVLNVNAVPVFADADPDTGCVGTRSDEAARRSTRRTQPYVEGACTSSKPGACSPRATHHRRCPHRAACPSKVCRRVLGVCDRV